MAKPPKEIIWTKRALRDLRKVYDFNMEIQDEAKAFNLVLKIIANIEVLIDDKFTNIGAVDECTRNFLTLSPLQKRSFRKFV